MSWITGDDLTQALADFLSKDVADLDPRFQRFCTIAVPLAQADLVSTLALVGYADATVLDSWDSRVEFITSQGLFRVGMLAVGLGDYNLDALKSFDMRPTLKDGIAILVDGVPIAPSSGDSPLGVAFGRTVGGQALDDTLDVRGAAAPWDRC